MSTLSSSHVLTSSSRNYHQVLVLLLRLRQICSHPCLIQEDVAAFVGADEDTNVKAEVASEVSRAHKLMSAGWVDEVKRRLKDRMVARMEAEKEVRIPTAHPLDTAELYISPVC